MSVSAWIKLEVTTPEKPEVIAIAERTRKDPRLILGHLVALWCWGDVHSVAGEPLPISSRWLDRYTVKGMSDALRTVGWLTGEDGALVFANFSRHNGDSAKKRAVDQRKKQRKRGGQAPPQAGDKCPPDGGTKRGHEGGPEEEEEIEERVHSGARAQHARDAETIVGAYPRREDVAEALKEVLRQLEDGGDAEAMLAGTRSIAAVIRSLPSGALNTYVPGAFRFFQRQRWRDDPETFRRQANKSGCGGQKMTDDEARDLLGGRV